MGRHRDPLRLTAAQRAALRHCLAQPELDPRQRNRAATLLDWDAARPVADTARRLGMTVGRVYALRRLYRLQGLEAYLSAPPQGGAPTKLTPAVETALAALITGLEADEASHWPLRRLAAYLVEQGCTRSISPATVAKAWQRLRSLLPAEAAAR
ncbi:helix-turn-helix domain-containing protein [Hymenobacter sp. 15J16-1T3B]|uniref:helix-turn-helix domain-containing protein n=1 Tax=Hymenobacter sp. 15J16-1T3B TaxID=2886941 RepID=UPI001D110439|nr:helix-turn-helix domain-containing protein [Hymenobacter sp. 15J16-1T3B]MCC3158550.1 helix-turn-helix domain-containing protein [Hymenobacter sp. 15J16-1T3B]